MAQDLQKEIVFHLDQSRLVPIEEVAKIKAILPSLSTTQQEEVLAHLKKEGAYVANAFSKTLKADAGHDIVKDSDAILKTSNRSLLKAKESVDRADESKDLDSLISQL